MMWLVYQRTKGFRPPMTISALLDVARQAPSERPMPMIPEENYEKKKLSVVTVGTNQTALQRIDSSPQVTRTVGLLTCACVIYVSTHPGAERGAWVHHAGSGVVHAKDVDVARKALGDPPWNTLLVVFAHVGDRDPATYDESMEVIVEKGVLEEHLVEVPHVPGEFGINNDGQVGTC